MSSEMRLVLVGQVQAAAGVLLFAGQAAAGVLLLVLALSTWVLAALSQRAAGGDR